MLLGRGARVRDLAGPARTGPDPPLHALGRRGRAGARADGQARADARGVRQADRQPRQERRGDRQGADRDRVDAADGADRRPRRWTSSATPRPGCGSAPSRRWCRSACARSSTRRSRCTARPASRSGRRSRACTRSQRTLRLADGPDEVHWHVVGRAELASWETEAERYDPKAAYYADLDGGGRPVGGVHRALTLDRRRDPWLVGLAVPRGRVDDRRHGDRRVHVGEALRRARKRILDDELAAEQRRDRR